MQFPSSPRVDHQLLPKKRWCGEDDRFHLFLRPPKLFEGERSGGTLYKSESNIDLPGVDREIDHNSDESQKSAV